MSIKLNVIIIATCVYRHHQRRRGLLHQEYQVCLLSHHLQVSRVDLFIPKKVRLKK
jgi:hypothetical protein